MAQGNRRPARHGRQHSRNANLINGGQKQQQRQHDSSTNVPDETTTSFIKRTLCKQQETSGNAADLGSEVDNNPLNELLPPLTSSNEIDVELYALIAVVLNLFVQTWYNKITPDQDFVASVVQIIAHCTRGLEQRLREVDLEGLLFDELPAVVCEHVDAIRIASKTTQTSNLQDANRTIYHALRPHHALTPVPVSPALLDDQQENESAWCQMVVNRALSLLLPYEEHQNPCLQVLVSEILSEMIFHNGICGKACESWLIWEGVTKIIYTLRPDLMPASQHAEPQQVDRLAQFGLLSKAGASPPQSTRGRIDRLSSGFWALVQSLWIVWLSLRSAVIALMRASSLPLRTYQLQSAKGESLPRVKHLDERDELDTRVPDSDYPSSDQEPQPMLGMTIWTCLSNLTRLQARMPWLTGLLSLMQWLSLFGPGKLCCTNSRLDRLLSHAIHARVLNSSILPPALQAIRRAIFPDNALGPARVPPTEDEVVAIKHECARVIVEVVPPYVRGKFFATDDQALMLKDAGESLDLFADAYINKHLIVGIVELIVLRLFPEIGEER